MVLAELPVLYGRLLGVVVRGAENVLHQPLVAARGGEHAAHQMIVPVRVREGVQGVVRVDAEAVARDENRAARAEGDVARAVADRAGADGRRGVVARAGADLDALGKAEGPGNLALERADALVALEEPGHLRLGNAAQLEHLGAPALVLDVEQEHAARVGVVAAVDAGEDVVDVVLRQHYLRYAREVLGLVFAHPEYLRRGEAGEGDVRGEGAEALLAYLVIEVVDFRARAPVVPEDGGAYHIVVGVERDEAVHLAARAYTRDERGVEARDELGHALHDRRAPVLGVLLAPARMREGERVLFRHRVEHRAALVEEQQLYGAGAEVDSYVKHFHTSKKCRGA